MRLQRNDSNEEEIRPYPSINNSKNAKLISEGPAFHFGVNSLFLLIFHRWKTFSQPTNLYCEMKNIDGVKKSSVRCSMTEK